MIIIEKIDDDGKKVREGYTSGTCGRSYLSLVRL